MGGIKKISVILFLAVVTYGITGLKSIAFCCGHCPTHETLIAKAKESASCCSEKEEHGCCENGCKDDTPCQVIVLDYDWDFTHAGWVQLIPSQVVVDALFPVHFYSVPNGGQVSRKISGFSPPALLTSTKNYLFLIRALLI